MILNNHVNLDHPWIYGVIMTPNKMIFTEKNKKKDRYAAFKHLHSNNPIHGILYKYGQPDLTQDAIALWGWGQ